jgi:hypothetical protein
MKKKMGPLSIAGILIAFLSFSSCNSGLIPYNTRIVVESERLTELKLTEKRVLIVSYDSDLTREFLISLKNYVREDIQSHKVVAERINIRANELTDDAADFEKLKKEFTPDYILTIKVRNERARKMYFVGGNVKTLRGMTLDFNLMPFNSESTSLWRSNAVVNHFYASESVATAKKIAKELGVKMQKDLIVN